jgi:hypothetical protein
MDLSLSEVDQFSGNVSLLRVFLPHLVEMPAPMSQNLQDCLQNLRIYTFTHFSKNKPVNSARS